jgi:hypothetical protein
VPQGFLSRGQSRNGQDRRVLPEFRLRCGEACFLTLDLDEQLQEISAFVEHRVRVSLQQFDLCRALVLEQCLLGRPQPCGRIVEFRLQLIPACDAVLRRDRGVQRHGFM